MRRLTPLLVLILLTGAIFAQIVHPNAQDGKIWFKLKDKHPVISTPGENPLDLKLNSLPFVEKALAGFQIKTLAKPFFAVKNDGKLQRTYELTFTDLYNVDKMIQILGSLPQVEYAELVPYDQLTLVPNDYNTSNQWFLAQINATGAWNYFSTGSTVTVAIVDNAVQRNHTDLSANIWVNPGEIANNGVDDDGNGYIDDINGWDAADNDNNPDPPNTTFDHGTHCAGDASASTNNGTGICGIGFSVKIIAVKATSNSGSPTSISAGYQGITYAIAANADVISCSWGGTSSSTTAQNIITSAWNNGSIVVAAAGNSSVNTPFYPAAYTNCEAVASTTTGDVISGFSNYGTWVDISAPGSNIVSTVPTNQYASMSGTSMACPLTAGLIGLMKSLNPSLSNTAILNCLHSTATNINSQNPSYIGQMGAGRINANNAMSCIASTLNSAPVAACSANPTSTCTNTLVQLTDNSTYNPTSWSWSMPGGTPSSSTLQNPTVQYASAGTYTVTLTASNSFGSSTSVTTIVITNNSSNLPFTEGFQTTTFLPTGWTPVDAGQQGMYWVRNTSVGGFSTSSACAWFDNYNQDAGGARDEMRSPRLNFTTLLTCTLRFDVAYARWDATYSDSLAVLISTNCGNTWTQVYLKGGNTLSTNGQIDVQNNVFVPTANQWRTETINLNAYIGQTVMVSFQNRGRYGQGLYVDNINITGTQNTTGEVEVVSAGVFDLYPNPNNGSFDINIENPGNYDLTILNAVGQVVYSEKFMNTPGTTRKIDLSGMAKGMYFVSLRDGETNSTKKVIVQ